MKVIDLKEVATLTGYSERSIQYAHKGVYKFKPILPTYRVIGCKIFYNGKWIDIPKKYRVNRLVFVKKEVEAWLLSLVRKE